jgi:hypothetical protein
MWDAQGGNCYLCGERLGGYGYETAIEHDHRCCPDGHSCRYCRRGLAHQSCNLAAGASGDDPDRLEVIAANLRARKAEISLRIEERPTQLALEV